MTDYLLMALLVIVLIVGLLYLLRGVLFPNTPSEATIAQQYVLKELHENVAQQLKAIKDDLAFAEKEIRELNGQLAVQTTENKFLAEKLATQEQTIAELQRQAKVEFENVANRLLEEKSEKFTRQNKTALDGLLQPLREKIKEFGEDMDHKFLEEMRQRASLKQEIEQLRFLNTELSKGAENLVSALKGDTKVQGDWGEFQLELILQKAGLEKNIHFRAQPSFKDEQGKQKRPDFIIELPNNRHLILDAKVSLVAYERYCAAKEIQEQQLHLAEHLSSIRRHIKDLSSKNYQQLAQVNAPDYLLLFIPIEPAFALALQQDEKLFLDALERNVVLVTSSTLLATMRTVAYIWQQERQKKNVLEIARQSGLLYDKFVNFVQDLKQIGGKMEEAQTAYHAALNKLKDSPKYGDTLVGRAERIKQLGAKTSKSLPDEWTKSQLDSEE